MIHLASVLMTNDHSLDMYWSICGTEDRVRTQDTHLRDASGAATTRCTGTSRGFQSGIMLYSRVPKVLLHLVISLDFLPQNLKSAPFGGDIGTVYLKIL